MNKLFFFLFSSLLVTNCAQQLSEQEQVQSDEKTYLTASGDEITKVAFSSTGEFSWSADDALSVYTTSASFQKFDLESGSGNASATFAGSLGAGVKVDKIAIYPYGSGHALTGKKLDVELPSSYTWTAVGNTHAPMMAVFAEGAADLSFRHLGGIVRVSFGDVPSDAAKLVFITEGRQISGTFTVADYTATDAVVATKESTEGNSVTILIPTVNASMEFNVPLPVGTYPGFRVELQDASGHPLIVRNRRRSFEVARKTYTLMGTINGEAFNGRKMLFDFGNTSSTSTSHPTASPDANGNHWNNIQIGTTTTASGNGTSYDLILTDGAATPYKLVLTSDVRSNGSGNGGLTQDRWSSTTATSLGDLAIATATEDYFFAQGASTVCSFKLTGLDVTKGYKFHIFGSRTGMSDTDERTARYTVTGSNSFTGTLKISGEGKVQNTDNLLISDVIYPKADGTVSFSFQKESTSTTNNYYQLNCMKVEEYEGGVLPVQRDYTSLEVTSAEETFLMHKANTEGNIFEGVSTFAAGDVSMTATTTKGEHINLTAPNTVNGVAYFTADLDHSSYTFQAVGDVLAQGSAVKGWSNSNGAVLPYQGHGVFAGTNLVFEAPGMTTAKAVSDPSRFNFLFSGSWNPTFKRVNGSRTDVEAGTYGSSDDIRINPGTYDITLDLRDFNFSIAPSSIDTDRITVMGSSVPRGYTATDYHGYIFMFEDILKASGRDWYVSNISVAGNNTLNLLDRYDELVTDGGAYVIYALSLGNEGIHEATDKDAVYNRWKTNMATLISQARADGKTVVVTGNYARADFTAADYDAVKRMNLEIHTWDVPSVNLLGAIDNGAGRWATGYDANDTYHPNNDGHVEMSYTMVPSLFDALKAGKALPVRSSAGSYTLSDRNVFKVTPEGTIHPFTVSFGIKTSATGTILTFTNGAENRKVSVSAAGMLSYQGISGTTNVADNNWHQVSLTHFYARGETLLYVDGVLQGSVSENLTAGSFYIGYADDDVSAQYREIFFWRSGMNEMEMNALKEGSMLKSSLEFYAPLNSTLDNLAQSTSTITINKL